MVVDPKFLERLQWRLIWNDRCLRSSIRTVASTFSRLTELEHASCHSKRSFDASRLTLARARRLLATPRAETHGVLRDGLAVVCCDGLLTIWLQASRAAPAGGAARLDDCPAPAADDGTATRSTQKRGYPPRSAR